MLTVYNFYLCLINLANLPVDKWSRIGYALVFSACVHKFLPDFSGEDGILYEFLPDSSGEICLADVLWQQDNIIFPHLFPPPNVLANSPVDEWLRVCLTLDLVFMNSSSIVQGGRHYLRIPHRFFWGGWFFSDIPSRFFWGGCNCSCDIHPKFFRGGQNYLYDLSLFHCPGGMNFIVMFLLN